MRLFTLVAGYVAGLAVAMKYRKNQGTSTLKAKKPITMDAVLDEVVDIHKSAFADVKQFVTEQFDDVDNFDDLKTKIHSAVTDFSEHVETAARAGTAKKNELVAKAEELYANRSALIEKAKKRATELGISEEHVESWVSQAKTSLEATYAKVGSTLDTKAVAPKKSPAKKTTTTKAAAPKKTPAKKTAAKK